MPHPGLHLRPLRADDADAAAVCDARGLAGLVTVQRDERGDRHPGGRPRDRVPPGACGTGPAAG